MPKNSTKRTKAFWSMYNWWNVFRYAWFWFGFMHFNPITTKLSTTLVPVASNNLHVLCTLSYSSFSFWINQARYSDIFIQKNQQKPFLDYRTHSYSPKQNEHEICSTKTMICFETDLMNAFVTNFTILKAYKSVDDDNSIALICTPKLHIAHTCKQMTFLLSCSPKTVNEFQNENVASHALASKMFSLLSQLNSIQHNQDRKTNKRAHARTMLKASNFTASKYGSDTSDENNTMIAYWWIAVAIPSEIWCASHNFP